MQRINSPPNLYILEIRLQGSVTSAGPRGKGRLMSKSLENLQVKVTGSLAKIGKNDRLNIKIARN